LKIYYIDVENIGLDKISEQIINISDKVFLFTHNSKRSTNVKDEYFYYINDYPTGDNQADFCIIANVSKLLSTINKNEINNIEIILFSKDKELWNAFQYQIK
jgi:hypothetical protein